MELDSIDAIDISLDTALYEREEEASSLQAAVQSAANRALDLLYAFYLIPAHCLTALLQGDDVAMVKVLESGNKTSLVFFSIVTLLALSPSIEDAICAEMPKTLDWLLKKEPIDLNKLVFSEEGALWGEPEFASPMCLAAAIGNIELLEILARHGASVSIPDPNKGCTPLHIAAWRKDIALADWLIGQDANLFAQSFASGSTPLIVALSSESLPLIQCFVEAGSPLHLPRYDGIAPLHLAICLENEQLIRYLVEKGAYIDQPIESAGLKDKTDLEGMSPLHLAIGLNRLETVKVLIEWGASLSSSFHGLNPLEFAKAVQQTRLRDDYESIITHLQEKMAQELPEPI